MMMMMLVVVVTDNIITNGEECPIGNDNGQQ